MSGTPSPIDIFLHVDPCRVRVLSFLTAKETLNFTTTRKSIRQTSCLGVVGPIPLVVPERKSKNLTVQSDGTLKWDFSWHWHDGDAPHLHQEIEMPKANHRTHSVTITCMWKDQGWGYRKGRLLILSGDDDHDTKYKGENVVCRTPHDAGHDWEHLRLEFYPEGSKRYFLWYKVGGGGGHELYVKNLSLWSLTYDH